MAWIKRNLFFVITMVAGLGVTGYCGYLLYSAMSDNDAANSQYASDANSLKDLQHKTPVASKENISAAGSDVERVRTLLEGYRKSFAAFPTPPALGEREFKDFLQKDINQFGTQATNAGVGLPPGFAFAFSQQIDKLNYPTECIAPWMVELEEIQAILNILYNAKINYLESIKRPSAGLNDLGSGDIGQFATVNNQMGVVTPYVVSFRAFSTEIANVLAGVAASSNCFIVKTIFVTPSRAPLPQVTELEAAPAAMAVQSYRPMSRPVPQPSFTQPSSGFHGGRGGAYGGGMRSAPPMRMQPAPSAAAPVAAVAPTAPVTVLRETPLFVTLYIDLVKPKASEAPAAAAKPKMAAR